MKRNPRPKLTSLRGNVPRRIVAKALDITPQALGMFERGERTPSLELAKKIADYYGVSVEEGFFTHDGHEVFLSDNTA